MIRALIIAAIILMPLRTLELPDGYNIVIGNFDPEMTLNSFIWFTANDLIMIVCSVAIAKLTKSGWAYLFVWFCVTKLIEDFVSPYGYSWVELLLDFLGCTLAIFIFVYKNLNLDTDGTRKRNTYIAKAN